MQAEVMEVDPGYSPMAAKGHTENHARTARLEKMIGLVLVVLFALFITQVVIGVVLAKKVDDFMASVEKMTSPDGAAEFLAETASTMMLGNPDGSISAYIQDMTEKDWGNTANTVLPLAQYVRDNMKKASAGIKCSNNYVTETCPDPGTSVPPFGSFPYTCSNGAGSRECRCTNIPAGATACAAGYWKADCTPDVNAECKMRDYSDIAAAVASILEKGATLKSVIPERDIGTAAMSQGLLRLDWIANWAGKQGGVEGVASYKTLAKQCKSLVSNVRAVEWSGSFTSAEGEIKTWSARDEVNDITDWVSKFCNALES